MRNFLDALLCQTRFLSNHPFIRRIKFRKLFQLLFIPHIARKERDDSNQRTNRDLLDSSIRIAEITVEKAIFCTPKIVMPPIPFAHGSRDINEVLKEFGPQSFISRVFSR